MKLSISVPDDLWSVVFEPEDSPSDLVQQGLRLLADAKQAAMRPFANAPDPETFAARVADPRDNLHKQFASAAESAKHTRDAGYTIGVDACTSSLTFPQLELVATRPNLRHELNLELHEVEGFHLPEEFLQQLWQDIHDYDQWEHLDKAHMRTSATFLDAVVDGIRDVYAALVQEAKSSTIESATP